MQTITGLRELGPGRVLVEVDGAPWREIPTGVAVRVGLGGGKVVDGELLRALVAELRREQALVVATRALARRPLSKTAVDRRLARRGVAEKLRTETIGRLETAGYLGDGTYAAARARELADRGFGDLAIRTVLEQDGVVGDLIEAAVAALASEADRANAVLGSLTEPGKGLALLTRRGFDPELVAELAMRDSL